MKMYKTGGWKELIEAVEVEKVTEKSVWVGGLRKARRRNYCIYWDTMKEAEEHLREYYKSRIESAERFIKNAKDDLEALNILVKEIK
jgi:hypothetical protein